MTYPITTEVQNARLIAAGKAACKHALGLKFKVRLDRKSFVEGTIVEANVESVTNRFTKSGTRVAELRIRSVLDTGRGRHTVYTNTLPR